MGRGLSRIALWVTVGGAMLLAGCNVFEGFGEEGAGNDPQVLLQDARTALDRGDASTALTYLERAFALSSQDPEIRITLGQARLAVADIDLFTLKGMVDHINEAGTEPVVTSAVRAKNDGSFCTFEEDPASLVIFDYTAAPEYQQIRDQIETLLDVRDLVARIPASDRDALSESVRAEWYFVRAFTRIALAIDAINGEVERIDATLYRVPSRENSLGICAASEAALEEAEARIKCDHLPQILTGLDELEVRSQLLDEADVSGVLDDLQVAANVVGAQLESSIVRFCSTNARPTL